jgi:hypothetical protein
MSNAAEAINAKVEIARITGGAALVTIWGMTLNEWAALAALAYTGAQFLLLLPRVVKQVHDWIVWVKNVCKK